MASSGDEEFTLEAYSELRIEIESASSEVSLTLISGLAEIFGTELIQKKKYKFCTGANIAIFTYHGCVLKVVGLRDFPYVSVDTAMPAYLDAHQTLQLLRENAKAKSAVGPVAMVVGPPDAGKSTLTRILVNYAVRVGGKPLYVDLDVGKSSISLPGTISATVVEYPANVEEGFSQNAPLVYHFGHVSVEGNTEHYQTIVSKMAESTRSKLYAQKLTKQSGMIINTCGWVRQEGYKQLLRTAQVFDANIIFVLEDERLYKELLRDKRPSVSIELLPKTNGVIKRQQLKRVEAREACVKQYFYGLRTLLHPYSIEVKFSRLKIYKIGVYILPDSCLPIGMEPAEIKTQKAVVTPNISLLHHLLAVSSAKSAKEDLVRSNIIGFVCVTKVNMEKLTLTLLSPQPAPLPKGPMIFSEQQFVDNF